MGLICQTRDGCLTPVGVTYSVTSCPNNYHVCPASFNGGCCMSGMGCGLYGCYSTEPVTSTVTQRVTTTSGTHVITRTLTAITIATPTPPTDVPTADNNFAAKFIPSSMPKVAAISQSSEPDKGGGLSGGAIGGIIAGVVVLLIVVVVAAFFIIRRLKRVEDIMESKQGSSSGKKTKSQSQARMERYGAQLHSQDDEMSMSIDPLMVPSNTTNNSTPQPGPHGRGRADSSGFSPTAQVFHHPDDDPRSRHASPDFSNQAYFDFPPGNHQQQQPPMRPARMRATSDSSGQYGGYAYHHWRQQSNASELSADGGSDNGAAAGYQSPPLTSARGHARGGSAAELEGQAAWVAELPSATTAAMPTGHIASAVASPGNGNGTRSRSGSDTLGHYPHGYGYGAGTSGLGLGPVDESAEMMHGYYGRRDQQQGQTAAGLGGGGGYDQPGEGSAGAGAGGYVGKPLPPPPPPPSNSSGGL